MSPFKSAVLLLMMVVVAPVAGQEKVLVAGRTLDEHAAELRDNGLGDQQRVARLRAIRSLAAFGGAAQDELIRCLDHQDAAVRYLAAEQLGRIGGSALEKATPKLIDLARDKELLSVRLAASYALCCAGMMKEHLPLLIDTLEYPERGMVCSSADLIGAIGPDAEAAIAALESTYAKHRPGVKGGDYHIGGAAMNALRKIRVAD